MAKLQSKKIMIITEELRIELFGYEELQTEADLNIGKLEDELENN
ncbi:hypothetical protein [Anoxybacillus flavithermus]|nr:hypothetical protein [Anoxybacillus flavithermus]